MEVLKENRKVSSGENSGCNGRQEKDDEKRYYNITITILP
jgi:hypothetical protein